MTKPLATTFRKPFKEQVAAFRLRLGDLVPTARWDDIERDAHDRAFMVAGATRTDLLADLAEAVDKAIADGTGFETFKRDFRAIVAKHGWHGWTGEGTEQGEAWRMRTIYRTNMRVSYMAGRHAQLTEGGFKYWIYRHGGSIEPRLQHLGWDRLVLEADHEFWRTHYPPNGWGCSCRVVGARSKEAAKRRGGDPGKALGEGWQNRDPRTGAPKGVGKGWDYAPGSSVGDTVLALRDKLDLLPAQPSVDLIQDWLLNGPFEHWLKEPQGNWPLVRLSKQDAQSIGAPREVADLAADVALRQMRQHPDLTIADFARAQVTVLNATHRVKDGPNSLVFVRAIPDTDGHILVVRVNETASGLSITDLRRLSREAAEQDRELQRLLRQEE
ncbi:virion morphogenesis protein [Ruegeria sediminis]|uniref:Virion morphogenesis protein n=1 Tax=Ruegeria sediminis TaxID=2583820 RepID=A0ABY2X374_9RHOB|nr:phage minor head protein [Ruegeria sediminis]TMV09827.1 virion morphogenesis protein [Ruegeria sediminis]